MPIRSWRLREAPYKTVQDLADALSVPVLMAQLLTVRGIGTEREARVFLDDKGSEGHDPFLFLEMESAVERILEAIERGQQVLVHGDYDVDGLTGTALLVETLRELGVEADYHIPHRIQDGYGLQTDKVAEFAAQYSLMITVDCGTVAHDALRLAEEKGLDVIVSDHHEPGSERPTCVALLNPMCPESNYPWRHLCGSAVAWKLSQALREAMGETVPLEQCGLDLAALGTIADVVPLLGENRQLVQRAFPILLGNPRTGIRALLEVSGTPLSELDTHTIGFRIGPRLNALGRLSDPFDAVELLLTQDEARAFAIASEMDDLNRKRQSVEKQITDEAVQKIESEGLAEDPLLVVTGEGWHPGVLGIVASRLVDKYHRPAIVLTIQDGEASGSGRSVAGKNLVGVLNEVRELLLSGGGHEMAIGMRGSRTNVERIRERLVDSARQLWGGECEPPVLWLDAEIPLERATLDLWNEIQPLAPHGNGNPVPLFSAKGKLSGYGAQVLNNNHLKFSLEHERGLVPAVAFGQGHKIESLSAGAVEVAFELGRNSYQGKDNVNLIVRDFRPIPRESLTVAGVNAPPSPVPPPARPPAASRPVFRCRLDRTVVGHVWKMIEKMQTDRGVDLEILTGLLRLRNIQPEAVNAAVQVLEEIGLLSRIGRNVQPRPATTKRDLSDSPTFRELSRRV